jgi:cell division protein FtsB
MSSQVREKIEGSATDLLQMQTRLRMMTAEYEKLSRENLELRARLYSLSDERLLHKNFTFSRRIVTHLNSTNY